MMPDSVARAVARTFFTLLCLVGILALSAACGPAKHKSPIYKDLGPDEDGTIDTTVDDEDDDGSVPPPKLANPGQLSKAEIELIQLHHKGRQEMVSFLLVDAGSGTVVRSHRATQLRHLGSVTKIATALAALENIPDVDIGQISYMLKVSHNGLASNYVRQAALKIDGTESAGQPNNSLRDCPSSVFNEGPAADSVLRWLKRKFRSAIWSQADLADGAGCMRANQFSSKQTIYLLRAADSLGRKYGANGFADLLSKAGVDGTWARRNLDSKGMIFAKTGTLGVASNLAGYVFVKQGNRLRKYYFAIFINTLENESSYQARELIEGLLRHWIKGLSAAS